jgi:hypothetical protein
VPRAWAVRHGDGGQIIGRLPVADHEVTESIGQDGTDAHRCLRNRESPARNSNHDRVKEVRRATTGKRTCGSV